MTATPPPASGSKRTFFSRRFAPLITTWIFALICAGLIYWFEIEMPAFHEVVAPLYAVIATLSIYFTWRWVRTRGRVERRRKDRRRTDRRDTAEHQAPPPEA